MNPTKYTKTKIVVFDQYWKAVWNISEENKD